MKRIELRVKEDLYDNPKKEGGRPPLIKKGVVTKIKPYLEDIRLVGTVVNHKGKELKDFCKVFIRDIGFVVINHTFEEIDKIQHEYNNGRSSKTVGFSSTGNSGNSGNSGRTTIKKRTKMGFK